MVLIGSVLALVMAQLKAMDDAVAGEMGNSGIVGVSYRSTADGVSTIRL